MSLTTPVTPKDSIDNLIDLKLVKPAFQLIPLGF